MSEDEPVRYEKRGPVAIVTMDRPDYRNAQNSKMTYALDEAYYRAADDDTARGRAGGSIGHHPEDLVELLPAPAGDGPAERL